MIRAAIVLGLTLTAVPAQASSSSKDACALLPRATVQKVVGEAVIDAKPTTNNIGELHQSQCFYSMHTFSNSVSVTLTEGASGHRDAAREQWQHWFHKTEREEEAERIKNKKVKRPGDDQEDEPGAKPVPVSGIGDDAFWVHSFVGNLYVLKGNQFVRISLGGKMDDEQRQAKAKALAADALKSMR